MDRGLMISIAWFFLSPAAALATWNPSGSPVCVAPGFQGDLIAVPVPEAYAIWSWQSMFTLWSDARDTVPASADLYFDLIHPLAPPDPPTNGSPAVAAPGFQSYADACFTGTVSSHSSNAGVIVAWADNRNGALDVYARRLFDSGLNTPWPTDGVPVCVATGAQSSIHIVGDARAGAILAWLDPRTGFNSVYAQRLDLNGAPQWAADGIPVCDVPGYRYDLRLAAAPDGGAYFVWTDDHLGSFKTFANRLLPDGTRPPGWPADGLPVSSLVTGSLGPAVADGAGGLYVTFLSGSAQPIACRIDPNAAVHAGWPADGAVLAVTPVGGGIDDAVVYQGGLVVVWRMDVDPQIKVFTYDLVAQRVRQDGTRPAGWGNDGNLLCDAPNDQVNARLAANAPAIMAVWEDSRVGSSAPDIYAMRLTRT